MLDFLPKKYSHRRPPLWLRFTAAALCILAYCQVCLADPSNRFRDSLKHEEKNRILNAIQAKNPTLKSNRSRNQQQRNSDFIVREPVLLLMENRPHDKKAGSIRMADVYYYDYQKDQTIHCIVDPATGKIHQQIKVRNMQLPLTEEEIQRTYDIYIQSPHRKELAKAYSHVTGQSLIDMSKVDFKAYVYHGEINESRLNKKTRRCGKTRCAQLLLYTDENIALNLSPVINLSKAVVVQGNTLPTQSAEPSTVSDHPHGTDQGRDHLEQ